MAKEKARELSIDQKKKFVELFDAGALHPAYHAYLGLSQFDVQFYSQKIDKLKKEVLKYQEEEETRLAKARAEANRLNELSHKNGSIPSVQSDNSIEEWSVPIGKEREFLKDASERAVPYLMEKWCKNKTLLEKEIARLEG